LRREVPAGAVAGAFSRAVVLAWLRNNVTPMSMWMWMG